MARNYYDLAGYVEPKDADDSVYAWKARAMAAIHEVSDLRTEITECQKRRVHLTKLLKEQKS